MEDHDQDRAAVENESLQLRADLKTWEGEWAATHGGRKPGRRDIKQNPDIGALSPPSLPAPPVLRLRASRADRASEGDSPQIQAVQQAP